jgi:hypothetical protein
MPGEVVRAELRFTYSDLAKALDLPEEAVITSIGDDRRRRVVRVQVIGAGKPLLDGEEPPSIQAVRPPDQA